MKLFFDSACPLCSSFAKLLKKRFAGASGGVAVANGDAKIAESGVEASWSVEAANNCDGSIEPLLQILPFPEDEGINAKDFKLETDDGRIFLGKEAIFELEKQVPQIKDFFWMLPSSYRGPALYSTYAVAKFFRKFFNFFTRKNCGEC